MLPSFIIRQAAFSSVNWRLKENPSFEKKSIDFFKSFTGKFTKICFGIDVGLNRFINSNLFCARFFLPENIREYSRHDPDQHKSHPWVDISFGKRNTRINDGK